jgi:CheY-like chemotaxis protein
VRLIRADEHVSMASNVVRLDAPRRSRVRIAHQRASVRHVLRTLTEADNVVVAEAADGEEALAQLERGRFDLLVLELDLPLKDGVAIMQAHRVLLAYEGSAARAPAVLFTLPPEVRGNETLTDHLRKLGAAGFIDDAPRPEAASLIEATLRARAAEETAGKPAAA